MRVFRFISCLSALVLCVSVQAQDFVWHRYSMDGSRTGVTAPSATNVPEALGAVKGGKYYAPNGKVFRGGVTPKIARLLIEAQAPMAFVKEVVGYSPKEMVSDGPESELSNWQVDLIMAATEKAAGKKVDIGLTNFGGIRTDMPQGDVLLDDIMSMFPFENHLCYVALKGSDVRYLFEQLARNRIQVVGGVEMTVRGRELVDLKVGGEPLDDEKVYGLATVDFLLNGGDGISAARNAIELITTDVIVFDAVIEHVRELVAAGEPIAYQKDGRVKILPVEE